MGHSTRHDPEPRYSEPGILSNVLSFVSREIGEFMINATGKAESGPSKRKRGRDGKYEERGRQRKGYDGGMIEQWREASGSIDGGGEKQLGKTTNRRKSSVDGRDRTRRKDGKRRASSGSRSRSQSAERSQSQSQSQSREHSRSRTRKTKARTSSDGKQAKTRAKSADNYGRKKYQDRVYPCRPEDADGELTPSITSRSPSPRHTSHSRGGKIRPQEDTSSSQHHPKDPSSSQTNVPLSSSHSEATYPQLRKKPSITMPGSLFPRSDSPLPEPHDEEMESRRVRFLSASEDTYTHEGNSNPIPRTPQSTFNVNAQDSEPGPSNSPHETPEDQTGPSPWRTRPIASVHDAVQRFTASGGEERDFSLLVVASPPGPADPESPGATPPAPPGGVSRKGKERAVDDGDEDLAFILDHHRVQDKEKQLDAVRRETGAKSKTTGDKERDRDKERIRILEEEVRKLKEELSRHHRSTPPQTQVPIPPPPPPLPPPPGVRIPLPPHLAESRALFASARAALRPTEASITASTNDLTRSASGKVRQPTVNVPSDKMAAFLNEMRTVRLRKVGSVPGFVPGGLSRSVSDRPAVDRPGPSGLSRSVSSSTAGVDGRREEMRRRQSMGVGVPVGSTAPGPASASATSSRPASSFGGSKAASTSKIPSASSIPKPKSISTASKPSAPSTYSVPSSNATRPAIYNKRKADVLGDSEGGSTSKRRSGTRAEARSDTSSSSTSSRTHEFSSGSTHSNLSLAGPSHANHSSRSNETDITTPSLCSDNELGADADGRMPSTPPGPRSAAAAVQSAHEDVIEIIDVDMEDTDNVIELAHKPITPSHPQGDLFRKRPPMSPLPVPTPTRVRAPARAKGRKSVPTPERTKRGATPKPKSIMLLDEDDDDDEEDPDELALPPKLKWRREAQPRIAEKPIAANSKGKRRLTLDEELARARSSDRLAELGLESGELFGTGTGNKRRGFLAGGGAGGAPVFMGAGYVRGVEEDGLSLPVSRIPRRRG